MRPAWLRGQLLGRHGQVANAFRLFSASVWRPRVLVPVGAVATLAGGLFVFARPRSSYLHEIAFEIGGALTGALIVVGLLVPLIARAREGRIRERGFLDYDLFVENLATVTSVVKILDTFSNLFDRPETPNALRAFEAVLKRQAQIRILLMHPDSAAAELRAEELHYGDMRQELLRNLRVLGRFTDRLDEASRRRFEVRLYTVTASNTLYRWDDRALISFLSIGRLSGDGTQLLISMDTSLGRFVEQHFEDLWASPSTVPLDAYRYMPLRLRTGHSGPDSDFALQYVTVDGDEYVASDTGGLVLAHVAQGPAGGGGVIATRVDRPDEPLKLRVVDDADEPLRESLTRTFVEKYGSPGQPFLCLEPAAGQRVREGRSR